MAIPEKRILLVTKPLVPPWNDSGKNMPRDLVRFSKRFHYTVFVTGGAKPFSERVVAEGIYSDTGRFSPTVVNQLRLFLRLIKPDRTALLYHFFFTPNPKTSMMGKQVMRLKRRRSLHTVTSKPAHYEGIDRLIFSDEVVVCSEAARKHLQPHLPQPVHTIYPGIDPGSPPDERSRRQAREKWGFTDQFILIYPGDLTFSNALTVLQETAVALLSEDPSICLVFACRAKSPRDQAAENRLKTILEPFGKSVRFPGEVDDMSSLLAASDTVIFPVNSLYGKMDIPLVLLEAMALERPLILSDLPPLGELMVDEPGIMVPAGDVPLLTQAIRNMKDTPDRRRQWGMNGRNSILNRFSAQRMADAYETIYSRMLS